jgi:hypothetical protein
MSRTTQAPEANAQETTVSTDTAAPVYVRPMRLAEFCGVRPQMVFNYIRDGRIVADRDDEGKLRIAQTEAHRWFSEYLERKAVREAKREAKLAAELAGESTSEHAVDDVVPA